KKFVGMDDEEEDEPSQEKDIEKAEDVLKEIEEEDKKEEKPPKSNNLIMAFQSFFGKSQPIIGKLYDGPKDGIMNNKLKMAAQAAEAKIASLTTPNVKGIIWNGNSFGTSPGDVQSALNIIMKHQKTASI